jgi:hypothetical protein
MSLMFPICVNLYPCNLAYLVQRVLTVHFLTYDNSHPDKVKLSANDTMEAIASKFVDITKAYKSYVPSSFLSVLRFQR